MPLYEKQPKQMFEKDDLSGAVFANIQNFRDRIFQWYFELFLGFIYSIRNLFIIKHLEFKLR